ncbi:hypothetical protein NKDENANG_00024 [Candidatus Entotheonellaceae bacterium PAL068K]
MEPRHRRVITVGMTASLTGRYSTQGRQARAGVQAWMAHTNRDLGTPPGRGQGGAAVASAFHLL